MPPKKRARVSKRAANSGKQFKSHSKKSWLVCCTVTIDDRSLNNTGKDDGSEAVSSAKVTAGGKRKATGATKESSESADPPQYSRWLMKSEPESRFENGIDVKVQSSGSLISTACC